ncbi:putative amidohydrolase [Nonomuraea thailandensis]|uniref:Amidohydrolase n=1 Tax=Nonomuraea thailandensis TaxID=1188745 RepID=A0A9X2GF30_9ACTN|nr:carbon-nitrogen hydrolase family protein [Nonomuraea thailandensis]MCP2357482.1 putative amidohydrolase [Nonomuraea thailandensis]
MRVAAVQYEVGTDPQANLAAGLRMIDAAAERGAELIVLPEFCNHLSWYESREHARALACRHGDAFLTAIAARASRHRAHVKLGVTLARPDGRTTGASLLYGPGGGLLGEADKQVLMGAENDHLDAGDSAGPVVPTAVGRLGMYACMEGVICEVTRGLALRGAQVLLNSLNSFAVDEAALHVPVRAAENQVWVVAANKVGPLIPADRLAQVSAGLGVPAEWLHGAGESQIVAPDGTVVERAPRAGEAVVVADIDPAAADAGRARHFTTRRPARYGPLAAPGRPRTAPAGAPVLPVAVVRGDAALVRRAAAEGARLIVLPEGSPVTAEEAARAVAGTDAHAVTGTGTLVGPSGPIPPPHTGNNTARSGPAASRPPGATYGGPGSSGTAGATLPRSGVVPCDVYELPWGRLAVIVGSAARHPEEFRLAALADADVVAVPFTPREAWELRLGLLERSAENRLNIVAAGQDGPGGLAGAILALPADFTLWTRWQGPFTGQISHPMVTHVKNTDLLVQGTVSPAQSVNRLVSRGTDLVAGRPWRLAGALVEGPQ